MRVRTQRCWGTSVWLAMAMSTAVVVADDRLAIDQQVQRQPIDTPPAAPRREGASLAPIKDSSTGKAVQPAATPAQISEWIAQLDDDVYLVRERATSRLVESGAAALDPLLAIANADIPEPADRAVWILRRIAKSREPGTRRQALERMVLLQNRPTVAASAREALALMHHNEAMQAIQQFGGKLTTPYSDAVAPYMASRIVIDNDWRGGDAGLIHLRELVGLNHVIIIGTNVSPEGLHELQHVADLKGLWLYGTKLQPKDVSELQSLLPQVEIDYRRGGLLGVGSNTPDGMGPAVVGTVQDAAAAAGIRVGDIIQKFESEPVPNFRALTTMIGKRAAGEEVTLEVLRGGEPIQFKLKLGQWKTYNF